jgi:toxin ParE1/3/4
MIQLRIADRAQEDLLDIWLYVARDSLAAADRLLKRLETSFGRLLGHPKIGRRRPEFGNEIRSLAVGSYVIFHRAMPATVEIIRVLHGRRDLPEQSTDR